MKKPPTSAGARVLTVKDYRRVEWKNGQGTTEEISIFPEDATAQSGEFLWRLSAAPLVEAKSVFSIFAGYERCLTLIDGEKLKLFFKNGAREVQLKRGEVCQFSGDEEISCETFPVPSKDLGLIFKKGAVKAEFSVTKIGVKPRSFEIRSRTAFIYAISGSVKASLYPGELKFTVNKRETLRLDAAPGGTLDERVLLLEPKDKDFQFAAIELNW